MVRIQRNDLNTFIKLNVDLFYDLSYLPTHEGLENLYLIQNVYVITNRIV